MSLRVTLERGEAMIYERRATLPDSKVPFGFAVTTRALYVPSKKWFAVSDPFYYARIPINSINRIRILRVYHLRRWLMVSFFVLCTAGIGIADYLGGRPFDVRFLFVGLAVPLLLAWGIRPSLGVRIEVADRTVIVTSPSSSNKRERNLVERVCVRLGWACQSEGISLDSGPLNLRTHQSKGARGPTTAST
jgi:hypothetical protein